MSNLDWKQLLKDHKAFCYVKPNRHKHDSGWRCFEVGYCTMDDHRIGEKLVLSEYSDHWWHHRGILDNTPPLEFNVDITDDGYLRIFSHQDILTWENNYQWLVSSFELEVMKDENL